MRREGDEALRRFELDGVWICLGSALLALVAATLARGVGLGLDVSAGVLGGGLLAAFSYRAIKGGVDAMMHVADPSRRPQIPASSRAGRALLAVKFFTRYALLALAAYVMLTRLRLHPVGLVAGALAPFLAAAVQVGRLSWARTRGPHP